MSEERNPSSRDQFLNDIALLFTVTESERVAIQSPRVEQKKNGILKKMQQRVLSSEHG